ncbi:MAG: hypothetical protein GY928_20660 [Colwellia sp.]|nr:hypothetical protein [Colwellia sp.]
MPEMSLMPMGKQQFLDNNGDPLASGNVHFYEPGTTTDKTVYSDSNGNTALSNPVTLDSAGRASIWINGYYKCVVKDSANTTIWTTDNVSSQYYRSGVEFEWVDQSDVLTFVSATQFTVPTDKTDTYHVGRRIRTVVASGTIYGTISAASAGGAPVVTTVTIIFDTATQMDSGLSSVAVGVISNLVSSVSSLPVKSIVSKTANYTLLNNDFGKKFILSANANALTLPAANDVFSGFQFDFLYTANNTMELTGTVNGFANVYFIQNEWGQIFSDGANWYSHDVHSQEAVGTIKMWHKSLTGVPQTLPWGWVECANQVLSDAESLLNGETMPDINSGGQFVRGSNTSGNEQANQNLSHSHATTIDGNGSNQSCANNFIGDNHWTSEDSNANPKNFDGTANTGTTHHKRWTASSIAAHINSNEMAARFVLTNPTSGSAEARPDNVSMVYIIKVK